MDRIIKIRTKWEVIFNEKAIQLFVKVFGMVAFAISTIALSKLFPFIHGFEEDPTILLAVIVAGIFFINETLATIVFACILFLAMSGGQAIVAIIAGVMCLFACGNPRLICALTALVPLLVMNLVKMESDLLSINLPFLIFFLCVYFNGKLANRTWRYGFPIYFTAIAYNFNLYGVVIEKFLSTTWPKTEFEQTDFNAIDSFLNHAGFETDLQSFDLTAVVVIILINLVACYIIYMLMSNKNINFLNLQVDMRDGIVFVVGIATVCIAMVAVRSIQNPGLEIPYFTIITQGLIAYVLTRPFASHQICRTLLKKQDNSQTELNQEVTLKKDYAQSIKEEIQGVVSTYLVHHAYDNILLADKYPINCILVYGKKGLDQHLVLEKVFEKSNLNITYYKSKDLLSEYIKGDNLSLFDEISEKKQLQVVVMERIEKLFLNDVMTDTEKIALLKYFIERIDSFKSNRYVLFILTTDCPEYLPEDLYAEGCISKVVYGRQQDSVLLGDTYRLICPVGKGGGGLVYKAYHERLETLVAVKKIIHTFANKHEAKTEAVVLKSIKHMYLPKVYDVFEEKGEFYTVMDFVLGNTLQNEMKTKGPLPQQSVLKWGVQLTDAVGYLHNQEPPIIHSDIKPGNIMLTPEGNICLIDFNISLIFDKDNSSIAVTPGYSPIEQYGNADAYYKMLGGKPEPVSAVSKVSTMTVPIEAMVEEGTMPIEDIQIIPKKAAFTRNLEELAKGGLSEKSDIYSLGATLYALLTGKSPARDFSMIEPVHMCNNKISKDLSEVIAKAMCIDPEDRYETVREFQIALRKITL